jgi:hypothetical protein
MHLATQDANLLKFYVPIGSEKGTAISNIFLDGQASSSKTSSSTTTATATTTTTTAETTTTATTTTATTTTFIIQKESKYTNKLHGVYKNKLLRTQIRGIDPQPYLYVCTHTHTLTCDKKN